MIFAKTDVVIKYIREIFVRFTGVVQLARTSVSKTESRGFKSLRPCQSCIFL